MADGEVRRVAFCGLGIMGGPMAANLARAGFELSVHTRTREKAELFAAEHGGRAAATPREAAEGASVVITMVPDAPEVEEVLLGEQGAVHGLGDDALAIDMSTIAPTAARAIGERLADDGVVRELEALDEMRFSLITERRRHAPPGAEGGENGAPGRNLLNGEELPPKASGTLQPGDRLRIETPGGGGHGK